MYLREIIFVTDVVVLTIETTKLVFKPFDIFWRFWNTRKRYVCEKDNIDGEKEDVDKVCSERYENLLTTQVENLQAVFYFNTKTFSALNYAQGFEAMVKELQIRSGLQSRKDELSRD